MPQNNPCQNNKIPIIGVTGISGSGTSTVSKILAEYGGFVVQADKLAHEVMGKDQPAYIEIVKTFGVEVLGEDGEINRRSLGGLVFGSENKEKMSILEQIIHPRVSEKIFALIHAAAKSGGYSFAVIDAPMLIESGLNQQCDSCWLITASDDVRLARITSRDGIDHETALRRLNSRKGDKSLSLHADTVIENNENLDILQKKIIKTLGSIGVNTKPL